MNISIVIPAYNEGEYIKELIETVRHVENLEEIIVMDDCSKPQYTEIYKKIPGIRLIRNEKNLGKPETLRNGIKESKGSHIIILDADLQNLTASHLNQAQKYAEEYDLIRLSRGADILIAKFIGTTFLWGGEHIFSREFFDKYEHELFDGTRWGLESNMNTVIKKHNIKFLLCNLVGVTHLMKSKKYNFWVGLHDDLNMIWELIIKRSKVIYYIYYRFYFFFHILNQVKIKASN